MDYLSVGPVEVECFLTPSSDIKFRSCLGGGGGADGGVSEGRGEESQASLNAARCAIVTIRTVPKLKVTNQFATREGCSPSY